MTFSEEYRLHRLAELKLLREVLLERDGGKRDRDHHQVRRVQTSEAGHESLVAADSYKRLTRDQALERLRSESARAASHVRPRVSAKNRQQVSGGSRS